MKIYIGYYTSLLSVYYWTSFPISRSVARTWLLPSK